MTRLEDAIQGIANHLSVVREIDWGTISKIAKKNSIDSEVLINEVTSRLRKKTEVQNPLKLNIIGTKIKNRERKGNKKERSNGNE